MVRISVELPDELAAALGRAATRMESSREALLVSALEHFLEAGDGFEAFAGDREAFEAWIAEGEADVSAGHTIPAEEVFAELRHRIASAEPRRSE